MTFFTTLYYRASNRPYGRVNFSIFFLSFSAIVFFLSLDTAVTPVTCYTPLNPVTPRYTL